jgi:hypothetical protein
MPQIITSPSQLFKSNDKDRPTHNLFIVSISAVKGYYHPFTHKFEFRNLEFIIRKLYTAINQFMAAKCVLVTARSFVQNKDAWTWSFEMYLPNERLIDDCIISDGIQLTAEFIHLLGCDFIFGVISKESYERHYDDNAEPIF